MEYRVPPRNRENGTKRYEVDTKSINKYRLLWCNSPETDTEDALYYNEDSTAGIEYENDLQPIQTGIRLVENNLSCMLFGAFVIALTLFGFLVVLAQIWKDDWTFKAVIDEGSL